ncbi:MAG: phosphonoacetaldehyde hydrolase [Dehalococcoidia bacterium]
MHAEAARIRLVVFDWAGTTVDHGCFAPVSPFIEAFRRHGVAITVGQARGPMGLEKKDHIRALMRRPDVAAVWRDAHSREPSEADVEAVFADFVPLQLERVADASRLVPGLLDCVERLRARGVRIGATTGYFAEAARRCADAAAAQGYRPDLALCPSDVPEGRPAPWMIFRIMQELRVYPPAAVLKAGDTVPDIEEGLNAGVWSAGVTATGSIVGLTEAEFAALPLSERGRRLHDAAGTLRDAGAHDVIESVAAIPALIDEIETRLARGEMPSRQPQHTH